MGQDHPPVDFLVSSSNTSLEEFELARLNKAANLRKELREIVDEWVDAEVDGRVARWILECRRAEAAGGFDAIEARMEPVRGTQLALNLKAQPQSAIRPASPISRGQNDYCHHASTSQLIPSAHPTQRELAQGALRPAATVCSADWEKAVPTESSSDNLRPPLLSGGILECTEAFGLHALFDRGTRQSSMVGRCPEEQDLPKADAGNCFPLRKRYRNRNSLKLRRRPDPKQSAEPLLKWPPVAAHSALQAKASMEPVLA